VIPLLESRTYSSTTQHPSTLSQKLDEGLAGVEGKTLVEITCQDRGVQLLHLQLRHRLPQHFDFWRMDVQIAGLQIADCSTTLFNYSARQEEEIE
jgi:hypothetical protein